MISVKDNGGSYVSVADLQNAMLEHGNRSSMISSELPGPMSSLETDTVQYRHPHLEELQKSLPICN
jgi:hypothetical protein